MGPIGIIGLAGADGAGKSTLASALLTALEDRYVSIHRINFADPLRREVADLIQGEYHQMFVKPTPDWMRNLLRGWGDYKRHLEEGYWVRQWMERLGPIPAQSLVLVDDVRYLNEARAIQSFDDGVVLFLDDAGRPDSDLLHELVEVRATADMGFTINSRAKLWADPELVLGALDL